MEMLFVDCPTQNCQAFRCKIMHLCLVCFKSEYPISPLQVKSQKTFIKKDGKKLEAKYVRPLETKRLHISFKFTYISKYVLLILVPFYLIFFKVVYLIKPCRTKKQTADSSFKKTSGVLRFQFHD